MIFSVVVPTYNRLNNLKKVLEALNDQDFSKSEFEVFVIDDGSTDGTKEYFDSLSWERPKLFILGQKHCGPATARNLGISRSSGRIIVFTDDDCLVPSSWLSSLERGYEMYPDAAGIGGYLEAPEGILRGSLVAKLEYYETHKVYKADNDPYLGGFESPAGGTNNMSYLKSVLVEVGMFDESFPVPAGEDADLKLRVVEKGFKIGYIPLKVTHLESYSFKSFVRRSIVHGVGSAFFEAKHGRNSGYKGTIREIVLSPLIFITVLKSNHNLGLSFLMILKNFLMVIGRLKYIYLIKK